MEHLSDAEYKLLKKIARRDGLRPDQLSRKEAELMRELERRGLVRQMSREEAAQEREKAAIMLDRQGYAGRDERDEDRFNKPWYEVVPMAILLCLTLTFLLAVIYSIIV